MLDTDTHIWHSSVNGSTPVWKILAMPRRSAHDLETAIEAGLINIDRCEKHVLRDYAVTGKFEVSIRGCCKCA